MKRSFLFITVILIPVVTLHAGSRSSANYSVTTDTTENSGCRVVSASYSNDTSLGGIAGVSTVAAPAETAKHGYVGQLYEVAALQLAATPATVNETATRQLSAVQMLDDQSTLDVLPSLITWGIQSGPLTSISTSGLVTAGSVYQDTSAMMQGLYQGKTATLTLTVLNTIADNFGIYAGDGIGDGWQVQYFGINSANAAPTLDLDKDGLNNFAEFALNLNPGTSSTLPVAGVRNGTTFEYTYTRSVAAMNAGVQFTVEWSDTLLAGSWSATGVTENVISDNGTTQQVKAVIPASSMAKKFARLSLCPP